MNQLHLPRRGVESICPASRIRPVYHIVEAILCFEGVKQRINESQRRMSIAEAIIVEQSDEARHVRSCGRRAEDDIELALIIHRNIRTCSEGQ